MTIKSERERLKLVISEAVLLLCKNSSIADSAKLSIEGIIGITFGDEEVILVSFKEDAKNEKEIQNFEPHIETDANSENSESCTRVAKGVTSMQNVDDSLKIVEVHTVEEQSMKRAAKRKRIDSCSEKTQQKTRDGELERSSNNVISSEKTATFPTNESTNSSHCDAQVKCEIPSGINDASWTRVSSLPSPAQTNSTDTEMKVNPEQIRSQNIVENQGKSDALSSPLGVESSVLNAVQCKTDIADDDCVFIKSEIFDLTDDHTIDFTCDNISQNISSAMADDVYLADASLQYTQLDGLEIQGSRSRPTNLKARYMEYLQSGCVTQAPSTSWSIEPSTDDPSFQFFDSNKNDASLECHICKTVLKSRQTLYDHIQGTHLSRYRYKCTHCGLGFKWRSMLSYHKKSCPSVGQTTLMHSEGL